jgi:16S rRNA (uracil1498-N3)-methyltransferase
VIVEDPEHPVLSDDDAHHLGSVLRLRPGQPVSVTDGNGRWAPCAWDGDRGLIRAGDVVTLDRPAPPLCVAFAPVKGDRNEWAVQKLVELGVDRIVLLRSERSVVRWDGHRGASHLEKLNKVARQALMQSRGVWLPRVEGVLDFDEVVRWDGAAIADPSGSSVHPGVGTVLVGPEGGWGEAEISKAHDRVVSLGAGVLRTETAAVAAGVIMTCVRAGLVTLPASSPPAGT